MAKLNTKRYISKTLKYLRGEVIFIPKNKKGGRKNLIEKIL